MRLKRIQISPELIGDLFTKGRYFNDLIVEGLPVGTIMVAAGYDVYSRYWLLDFTHPSFEEIGEGAVPVSIPIVLRHNPTKREIKKVQKAAANGR